MDRNSKLHGIAFAPQSAGSLSASHRLYVEAYFHLGERYTRSWLDKGAGPVLLTPVPVADSAKDYEYDLYKRASALYPSCPSDGYEMLRFGRILSTPAVLRDPASRQTWVSVVFDEAGKQGYVNIAEDAIVKLSDADFAFFTGWKKLSEDAGPFDADGLCDIDSLKKLLGDVKAESDASEEKTKSVARPSERDEEDKLIAYVKSHPGVRAQLRGLVCEAPSEWDGANHEARYGKLKQAGEFYENNPEGYADFMHLLDQFQFWGSTKLPAGEKLWFFHPLEFIRHFRKCGWLNLREIAQAVPAGKNRTINSISQQLESQLVDPANGRVLRPANLYPAINASLRKYGITTSLRRAHYFGQILQETGLFSNMRELDDDAYFTLNYEDRCRVPVQRLIKGIMQNLSPLGNCAPGDGVRFSGKGMIQLTGKDNYKRYQDYRGGIDFTIDPAPEKIITDAFAACDVGGYYWVSKQRYVMQSGQLLANGKLSVNYWVDSNPISEPPSVQAISSASDAVTRCVNKALEGRTNRISYFTHTYSYFSDITSGFLSDFRKLNEK